MKAGHIGLDGTGADILDDDAAAGKKRKMNLLRRVHKRSVEQENQWVRSVC